ncbi:solute carrier family 22 member 23 isoform X1 [Carassius gibelio]|uniref:solute carrier family 22 member 23 isoform X1 n=1 Tax=Carassius gibelio TaxID=101364 RepID=UPI002277FD83|nr:solute carrier family 22 member 23 isoform X1 [Carassius gibelio]
MCETVMAVSQLDIESHPPENGFVTPETDKRQGLLSQIDNRVLPHLGGFGRFQKLLVLLTCIPAIFIGFSQFSDSFLLYVPHPCAQVQPNSSNVSAVANGNNPTNGSSSSSSSSSSSQCVCTQSGCQLQIGLEQNVVTKWKLVGDSDWIVHIAKFSLLVGSIFGYLVLGVLADWIGRYPVLILSVIFMLFFGITVAFSVNVPMFITLRFFEGFCLAGITLSLYALRIELCLPGWRFSMTMVANFMMLAGQLLLPGLAVLCRDWQVMQVVVIAPLLLMLSYIWIFPESLRWLLATQQYSRSKWIMERIAVKNNINLEEDAEELMTELKQALPKQSKRTCIVKMVGIRTLWKNLVVLCVNSLTGYGIHHCFARSLEEKDDYNHQEFTFPNFFAKYYSTGGIAVASCVALCPAVGVMGRRGGLLLFMIITALASLLQLGLLNLVGKYGELINIGSDTLNSNFSKAFSIIGMFSSHAVSNLSIFFCAEVTPTVIRGGGLGLVLASAGFGMLTAPIMELHNQKGYFLHHIIFACCTLICIICILLLPEPRNRPLPEALADGESYTRQPLLPIRKPGEQRLLLTKSESRENARVGDTPLHEAAVTAVSTMDSTASPDIDLLIDAPRQTVLFSRKTSTQEQDKMKQSASMPETFASSGEDRLLASIPNTSTPVTINYIQTPRTEVLLPSSTVETPSITDPTLETSTSANLQTPSLLDIVTPAELPSPVVNDISFLTEVGSTGPAPTIPLCTINLSDPSTGQSPAPPSNEIPLSSSIDSPVHLVTSSPTELPLTPIPDQSGPVQSFSSPIDPGTPLLHIVAQPVINSIKSGPSSPAVLEPTLNNGTTPLATVSSTAPHATTTDSVTESSYPLMIFLTVSSPIDSGIPIDIDLPITETNTANGETSS